MTIRTEYLENLVKYILLEFKDIGFNFYKPYTNVYEGPIYPGPAVVIEADISNFIDEPLHFSDKEIFEKFMADTVENYLLSGDFVMPDEPYVMAVLKNIDIEIYDKDGVITDTWETASILSFTVMLDLVEDDGDGYIDPYDPYEDMEEYDWDDE